MANKFKVGDRVRALGETSGINTNETDLGVVVSVREPFSTSLQVKWDRKVGYGRSEPWDDVWWCCMNEVVAVE